VLAIAGKHESFTTLSGLPWWHRVMGGIAALTFYGAHLGLLKFSTCRQTPLRAAEVADLVSGNWFVSRRRAAPCGLIIPAASALIARAPPSRPNYPVYLEVFLAPRDRPPCSEADTRIDKSQASMRIEMDMCYPRSKTSFVSSLAAGVSEAQGCVLSRAMAMRP